MYCIHTIWKTIQVVDFLVIINRGLFVEQQEVDWFNLGLGTASNFAFTSLYLSYSLQEVQEVQLYRFNRGALVQPPIPIFRFTSTQIH